MKQPRTVVPHDKAFFSSDWHLSHANVIKYDKRPFKDTYQMNTAIIANFSHLKEDDHLFFLGDLCFDKDPVKAFELIKNLKCKLYWIIGNHDTHLLKCKELCDLFEWILPQAEIYVVEPAGEGQKAEKQKVVLNHYSMEVWNKSHRGSYHLFGHSHGSLPDNPNRLSFDVGCNVWDYKPVSYAKVKKVMATKTWVPIDHHTADTGEGTLNE